MLRRGGTGDFEHRIVRRDGGRRTLHCRARVVLGAIGAPVRMIGSSQDVTERRAAEEALRASEARFRAIHEYAGVGIAVTTPDGRFVQANPAFCEMLGYTESELRERTNADVTHPDHRPMQRESVACVLAGELRSDTMEKRYLRKDGSTAWGRTTVSALHDPLGAPSHLVAVIEDVSERRRAEAALHESESRFAHIAASVPGMVYQYVYHADGTSGYTFVSEGARSLFGVAPDDALRDPAALLDLIHPDERDEFIARVRAAAASLGAFRWEGRAMLPSGEERFIQVVARDERLPDGSIASDGIATDMTELRRAAERLEESEQQLRQAQKMEAVGRLAGGIAHDFNNLLTVIQNCTAFGIEQLPEDTVARVEFDQALHASERAATLTRQLLAFSRQQVLKPRHIELNQTVTSIAEMLRRLIGDDIRLQTELDPAACQVLADPGQLTQVLMNLAVNARDAMPTGGTLCIRTGRLTVAADAERRTSVSPKLGPGEYVSLMVEDTGTGIAPEVLPRIFEPFYTTKEVGRGTGLGLSTVYGIIAQSGGEIFAENIPGSGSRFTVLLPRAASADEPAARPERPPRTGTEAVLLIEDDPDVRSVVRRQLERLGYMVREAASGEAALRIAAGEGRLDLVLTDLVMPGLSGRALVSELLARRPGLRVVFMSGYTNDEVLRRGLTNPGVMFLEKPFVTTRLAEILREALDDD